jgi:hypothetical protein
VNCSINHQIQKPRKTNGTFPNGQFTPLAPARPLRLMTTCPKDPEILRYKNAPGFETRPLLSEVSDSSRTQTKPLESQICRLLSHPQRGFSKSEAFQGPNTLFLAPDNPNLKAHVTSEGCQLASTEEVTTHAKPYRRPSALPSEQQDAPKRRPTQGMPYSKQFNEVSETCFAPFKRSQSHSGFLAVGICPNANPETSRSLYPFTEQLLGDHGPIPWIQAKVKRGYSHGRIR